MIVCLCAGVPTSTIQALIERGAACPEDVMAACGAGGDCGACLDSLSEMLAQGGGAATLDLDLASS
ncbi:MAG TPA: (2Fe-2S)-binding protein [Candidatus Acidoferrum sp.]|jgi:bacterioferritin-associated ferredoxin|nr:(2Fe-2S)-binding protein [Candidatus Acidoferrum sp.]